MIGCDCTDAIGRTFPHVDYGEVARILAPRCVDQATVLTAAELQSMRYQKSEQKVASDGGVQAELSMAKHGRNALVAERRAQTYSLADTQRGAEAEPRAGLFDDLLDSEKEILSRELPAWRRRSVSEAPAPKVDPLPEAEERGRDGNAGKAEGKLDPEVLRQALEASMGSVAWPHARLMVRGKGGVGKSSTINAMAGKEFDAAHKSTVGAGAEELELKKSELTLGKASGPLSAYASAANEYELALAAHAAASMDDVVKARKDAMASGSIVESIGAFRPQRAPRAGVGKGAPLPSKSESAPPSSSGAAEGVGAASAPTARKADAAAKTPPETSAAAPARSAATGDTPASGGASATKIGGEGGNCGEGGSADHPPAAALMKPPSVSPELVIKYRTGELQQNLVLKVQDTGGQAVFLSILELLTTPEATVYMVVFSLAELAESFFDCVESTIAQIKSIQLFAAGAPLILAGTRKGEVKGGAETMRALSGKLLAELRKRCAPAIGGLIMNAADEAATMRGGGGGGGGGSGEGGGLCFFAIENSQGYHGDATIKALVAAVETAAHKLPSMKRRVPLPWLGVYDEIRRVGATRRKISFSELSSLAQKYGLPHPGFTLEQELGALLSFFHSLNAVLWYDVDALRDLVILDPQWVLDAVTCFIRDFKLKDHTESYRMAELDQQARRREPEAWEALVEGARLHSKLLQIMWSGDEFKEHKVALLDLATRYGLAVAVPGKQGEFIVPALLKQKALGPPRGWPTLPTDAAQLRLWFHLDGQGCEEGTLVLDESYLGQGFCPIGVFHRLCAGALGCAYQTQTGAGLECALDRSNAYVTFNKTSYMLHYLPAESSVLVRLTTDGKDGSAAAVADQLRVLLCDELSTYTNLQFKMLVALQPGASGGAPGVSGGVPDASGGEPDAPHVWIDLDELPRSKAVHQPLLVRGQHIGLEALKAELSFWLTAACDFYFVDAQKLREATPSELPRMLRLQDLRLRDAGVWIVKKRICFDKVIAGEYAAEYLAVSHRWETADDPDPQAVQLKALRAFLLTPKGAKVRYVFYDFMSMPQGDRSPRDKADFLAMLPNINLLYLGCSVLILMDRTYMSRFWTQFEAWLSMQEATAEGLVSKKEGGGKRVEIECLHGTPASFGLVLREEWLGCTAELAHKKLSGVDVTVTNMRDKATQLPKILQLDQAVKQISLRRQALESATQLHAGRPRSARGTGGANGGANGGASGGAVQLLGSPLTALSKVEGLAELLQSTRLSDKLDAALAWCDEQGFDAVEEIVKTQMGADFTTALQLKPGKAKLMLKELEEFKAKLA